MGFLKHQRGMSPSSWISSDSCYQPRLIQSLGWRMVEGLPSLKLTFSPLKMDGWLEVGRRSGFLLGKLIFRCELLVSGRVYIIIIWINWLMSYFSAQESWNIIMICQKGVIKPSEDFYRSSLFVLVQWKNTDKLWCQSRHDGKAHINLFLYWNLLFMPLRLWG